MKEEKLTDAENALLDEFARRRKEYFWSDVFKYMDLDVEKSLEKVTERLSLDKLE